MWLLKIFILQLSASGVNNLAQQPENVDKARQYRYVSNLDYQPLSPLDGRYYPEVSELGNFLSEAGLNRARIAVEIQWLIHLAERDVLKTGTSIDAVMKDALVDIVSNFSTEDIGTLKALEATTRHDVKAVEYFIRKKLEELGRTDLLGTQCLRHRYRWSIQRIECEP